MGTIDGGGGGSMPHEVDMSRKHIMMTGKKFMWRFIVGIVVI